MIEGKNIHTVVTDRNRKDEGKYRQIGPEEIKRN